MILQVYHLIPCNIFLSIFFIELNEMVIYILYINNYICFKNYAHNMLIKEIPQLGKRNNQMVFFHIKK